MDPAAQNWLAFSLSNSNAAASAAALSSPSPSLYQSFQTTADPADSVVVGVGDAAQPCILSGGRGPKLEDFLGGGGGGGITGGAPTFAGSPVGQLPLVEGVSSEKEDEMVYGGESELKRIAASFRGGFCAADNQNHNATTITNDSDAQKQQQQQQMVMMAALSEAPSKKAVDTFGQRTSIYRGVTRHRWTGRYEAHLWDNSCRREGQSRKGRQVYLGGYDKEEKAARAYDLAALKYWGHSTSTNFPISSYEKEVVDMKNMTRQEFVASLRRRSSGFSRGASIYRGVTRHHQHGRWQARIGRVAGNKDLYLGTFSTQEEAAEAYDIAAIKFRGLNAVTNFDMSRYDVKSIAKSNLPVGGEISSGSGKPNPSSGVTFSATSAPLSFSTALPIIKPEASSAVEYWAHIFGSSSPLNSGGGITKPLFSSSSSSSSIEFSGSYCNNNESGDGCGSSNHVQQHSVPYTMMPAAGMYAECENENEYGNNGYETWACTRPYYTLQVAGKPTTVSVPIFGME